MLPCFPTYFMWWQMHFLELQWENLGWCQQWHCQGEHQHSTAREGCTEEEMPRGWFQWPSVFHFIFSSFFFLSFLSALAACPTGTAHPKYLPCNNTTILFPYTHSHLTDNNILSEYSGLALCFSQDPFTAVINSLHLAKDCIFYLPEH